MRSLLAIAIPTFNRAEILDETIGRIGAELRRLDIPLVIRDDSGGDETATRVEGWIRSGLRVDYRRNRPRLGHDANLLSTLMTADAEHVWLLGDALVPDPTCLELIHRSLSTQDFVFLNGREETSRSDVEQLSPDDLPRFMAERVWEFTLTGATIYGPRVIEWGRSTARAGAYPNFCQLGLILSFMQHHADTQVTRLSRRAIRSTRRPRESYWAPRAVEVFGRDWCGVIGAHVAVFGESELPRVLKSHSDRTGILGARHLLALRSRGCFSLSDLRTHRSDLVAASNVGRIVAFAIAILPIALARQMQRFRVFRKKKRPRAKVGRPVPSNTP